MTGRKRGRADEEGSPQLDQAYIDLIKDPDYVELADGEILVGKKLIPFHSAMLGYRSKVLRVMLRGTDKDGWAAGFAKAFEGCKDNDVRLFFAIAHDSNIKVAIKALDRSNTLEGVAQIAHKLDTPAVISVCERYLKDNYEILGGDCCLRWFAVASTLGLADIKYRATGTILQRVFSGDLYYCPTLGNFPIEEWDCLTTADLLLICKSMSKFTREIFERVHDSTNEIMEVIKDAHGIQLEKKNFLVERLELILIDVREKEFPDCYLV